MPHFSVTRRLGFAARDLYAIAADVGEYPAFVPLCQAAHIWDETVDSAGQRCFRAELTIAYGKLGLSETFVSDVTADPAGLEVRAQSNQGPLKHLDNRWRFIALESGATDVDFTIDYQLARRGLRLVMAGVFEYAMNKVLHAFEQRAQTLYGHK